MKNLILVFICLFIVSCEKTITEVITKEITKNVYIEDTTKIQKLNNKIDSLEFVIDSITNYKDSIISETNSKLFVKEYQIQRVKYYVDVAKKGNNIKYLRGWILRVFEE